MTNYEQSTNPRIRKFTNRKPMTPRTTTASTPRSQMRYMIITSLVAALGGFLFGYDTAVISGAIGFLQERFQLSADLTGWAASSLLVGCIFGAAGGGPLGDRFGRRASLMACAFVFAASGIASAMAGALAGFAWARFVGGLAIGAASILSPLYIAEVAPARYRGRLVALYQLAIVMGILIVFIVNLLIQRAGNHEWNVSHGWRWMLASLAVPAVVFGLLLLFVPESPRWLVKRGRDDAALGILGRMNGAEAARAELAAISASLQAKQGAWGELFGRACRKPLVIGAMLAIFQQFCGINSIMYYGPMIFKATGSSTDSAFVQTVTVGIINLVFTFVAIALVDKAGRKPLLVAGSFLQALMLGVVIVASRSGGGGVLLLVGVLGFAAAFSMSTGPVVWIIISEIFPNHLRGRAMAVCTTILWLACYVVAQTFPRMLASLGPQGAFGVYAAFSLACGVFVLTTVRETKGRPLEEIGKS